MLLCHTRHSWADSNWHCWLLTTPWRVLRVCPAAPYGTRRVSFGPWQSQRHRLPSSPVGTPKKWGPRQHLSGATRVHASTNQTAWSAGSIGSTRTTCISTNAPGRPTTTTTPHTPGGWRGLPATQRTSLVALITPQERRRRVTHTTPLKAPATATLAGTTMVHTAVLSAEAPASLASVGWTSHAPVAATLAGAGTPATGARAMLHQQTLGVQAVLLGWWRPAVPKHWAAAASRLHCCTRGRVMMVWCSGGRGIGLCE